MASSVKAILAFASAAALLSFHVVASDILELRDVKFSQDYNKNEMPPSHNGKPLQVRILG